MRLCAKPIKGPARSASGYTVSKRPVRLIFPSALQLPSSPFSSSPPPPLLETSSRPPRWHVPRALGGLGRGRIAGEFHTRSGDEVDTGGGGGGGGEGRRGEAGFGEEDCETAVPGLNERRMRVKCSVCAAIKKPGPGRTGPRLAESHRVAANLNRHQQPPFVCFFCVSFFSLATLNPSPTLLSGRTNETFRRRIGRAVVVGSNGPRRVYLVGAGPLSGLLSPLLTKALNLWNTSSSHRSAATPGLWEGFA